MTKNVTRKTAMNRPMTPGMASAASENRRRRAWAPLPVRLILAVVAMLCLAACVCGGANLVAISTLRDAAAQLDVNLEAASKEDADLALLAVQQQQTDNRFADAASWSPILLPQVRQSIAGNAKVSRELSRRIAAAIKRQSASQSPAQPGAASQQQSQTQGLTKEQRDKVNQLLEANRKSADTQQANGDSSTNKSGTSGTGDSTTKPW